MFVFINHLQKTFVLQDVMKNVTQKKKEGILLYSALCGACCTALVVPISSKDAENIEVLKTTVAEGENFSKLQKVPPRSGSIAKFAQAVKKSLESGETKDGEVKERLNALLKTSIEALKNPEAWKPDMLSV
ncbi:hypothetical protein AGDE_16160 [Angomonas deanei]|uniref:Uncharacterized protein n=1 Tax=Angomonas deanei TaxID=59799 RepID=A0A7G2C2Y6_9TRYP|nr:hypothetical protein AGDE_16160 [Angomonas deanei]CAD2213614.1 hypothetical protein, conserved [Angomonas deanei]|eukprot:EPY17604.1 hypothetical protein AGDE_16160 [Angomonas deanei]